MIPLSSSLTSLPTLETLLNHRSVRKFSPQAISDDILTEILQAGRAVSTSSFLQAVSIIRVTDKTLRHQFRQISNDLTAEAYQKAKESGQRLGHDYVENCAEFLVFCADSHRHKQLVKNAEVDWTEVLLIGTIDTALMAQNIMAAAESLGLGGVYIGSLRNDIQRASQLLNLPRYVVPLFGLCLGYPDEKTPTQQRPRLPLHVILSENQYHPASETELEDYNQIVKDYYQKRSQIDLDWRQQIENTLAKPVRPQILDYLHQQGFAKK